MSDSGPLPSPEPDLQNPSKRKRDIIPEIEDDKLEIDVTQPEPPSKKAKRKEKKLSKTTATQPLPTTEERTGSQKPTSENAEEDAASPQPVAPAKRSQHGIWIGNLPFKATKDSLRQFLLNQGGIDGRDVTRVHMPLGEKGQNKGFAYVDFTTPAVLEIALSLSEKLIAGRRCLIKNANSFEGRPAKNEKEDERAAGYVSKKEPSKRVFVGNLSFDVTKDELADHFSQAGEIEQIFMATFEDSGKCKGFGWVTFAELEAAESAVRGFILKEAQDEDEDDEGAVDGDEGANLSKKKSKPKKPRKWFINRIHGRILRCEFAEDPHTRYNKRFGKGARGNQDSEQPAIRSPKEDRPSGQTLEPLTDRIAAPRKSTKTTSKASKEERREERRNRHDARRVAPGETLANAPRSTGAIVAGSGTKLTFD